MIDHTGLTVSDVTKSKAFYRDALAPLGYSLLIEFDQDAGFGVAPKPDFWIGQGKLNGVRGHVAFRAETRQLVDAFYEAAMAAGGTDNGAPGVRPHYHPNYYCAFVLDPDGYNIEAVCHEPV